MSENGLEIEAKFYISQLDHITTRLQGLQARLVQPRVLETNLRFDLPNGGLHAKGQVLRLRRDTEARLTFKSSGQEQSGVVARQEIEFVVEDFEKARQFLQALGYQEVIIYEKYRRTFELDGALIMLDELPYGNFLEIEGGSVEQIQAMAAKLDLEWDAAIRTSYTALFSVAANSLQLPFRDITFSNFERISVTAKDLHVRAADLR
jgi:adenylate cyclase, class 2